MALYSTKELKNKGSFKSNVRELELEPDVTKKIWIPSDLFCYKRVHFHVKQQTNFTDAKFNTMDCFNNNYGENGAGCPVCKIIEGYWAKWREEADKEKQRIWLDKINQLRGEYFFMNCIDLGDKEHKFVVVSFTKSKMDDVLKVIERVPIEKVVWHYKKTKTGQTTKYSLVEIEDDPIVEKLIKVQETLESRSYDEGGPIDLEKAMLRNYTKSEYMLLLNPDSETVSNNDLLQNDILDEKPKDKIKDKQKDKPNIEVEETISLEDIGLDSTETEKDNVDTSLDDIDSLKLDDLDDAPKMFEVTPVIVNEKRKEVKFINYIYDFLLNKNLIKKGTDYKTSLQNVFDYVKSKGKIEVPEMEQEIPF